MSPFEATARRAAQHLNAVHARWAFVGGLAVSSLSYPRFTNDIDAIVDVDSDRDAESLVAALLARGYEVLVQLERDDGRLSTIRLLCPAVQGTQVILDLLFASTGIERQIVAAATKLKIFPTFTAPVATPAHLIAMKLLAVRPGRERDDQDLLHLLAGASSADIEAATSAIAAIGAAGQGRDRDLAKMLDDYLRRAQEWKTSDDFDGAI